MSLSDEGRRIVEDARLAYGPSDDDRARVAASLSLQLTAAATPSAGVAATGLAGKTVVGLAVLVAVGGASVRYWWARGEPHPRAASPAQIASPPALPPIAEPSAPAPRAPAPTQDFQAPPARSNRSRSAPAPRAAVAAKSAPPEVAPDVAGEIALLDEAQRALAGGHPDQALQALDRHAREFPRGSLVEERMAARIIALCALGRATAARAESAAFVQRFPSSPLGERVRAACGTVE